MKRRPSRQQGMTLPELLVALALGLGVLLAAALLLAGANASYVAHADALEVDDGGRYALALIGRAAGQGGLVDWDGAGAPAAAMPAPIAGLDNRSLPRNSAHISSPTDDAVGGSDVLALRFTGAGSGPGGDGSVSNCAGFPVRAGEPGWSIFYVARNSEGVAELRCKYRGAGGNWSADAIVAGVDGFQVLYGLDTDSPADGVPNRYVNASTLNGLDAAPAVDAAGAAGSAAGGIAGSTGKGGAEEAANGMGEAGGSSWWRRVASVQVALLLHGERPARAPQPSEYLLFGPEYAAAQGEGDPGVRLAPAAPANGVPQRRLFGAVFAVGPGPPAP